MLFMDKDTLHVTTNTFEVSFLGSIQLYPFKVMGIN